MYLWTLHICQIRSVIWFHKLLKRNLVSHFACLNTYKTNGYKPTNSTGLIMTSDVLELIYATNKGN